VDERSGKKRKKSGARRDPDLLKWSGSEESPIIDSTCPLEIFSAKEEEKSGRARWKEERGLKSEGGGKAVDLKIIFQKRGKKGGETFP